MTDTLYTCNGSYPAPLPTMIMLPDGFIRSDPVSFTPEEIEDAGYVAAPEVPAYDPATEQLGWDGEAWVVSALPTPLFPYLTRRQLLLGLLSIQVTEDEVDAQIDLIADAEERAYARIEWKAASTFSRHHPLVDGLAIAFTLTTQQVDDLWRWAAGL